MRIVDDINGARITRFVRRTAGAQVARSADKLRGTADTPAFQRAMTAIEPYLPATLAERWQATQVGLWLIEAFLVTSMILGVIFSFSVSVPNMTQDPDYTGLAFLAIVLVPALILAARRQYKIAREVEAHATAERKRLERQARRHEPELARAYRTLYLQPGAPLHIAQAAYAAAMKKNHPDIAGGDDQTAKELNWAIETLREHGEVKAD